jgi:hypothetical protein
MTTCLSGRNKRALYLYALGHYSLLNISRCQSKKTNNDSVTHKIFLLLYLRYISLYILFFDLIFLVIKCLPF